MKYAQFTIYQLYLSEAFITILYINLMFPVFLHTWTPVQSYSITYTIIGMFFPYF